METLITALDLRSLAHQLIDVRSPSEFAGGHIPGAINIPLEQIESRVADVDPAAPTVLICQAGARARIAATLLAPCRSNLAVLDGGMNAWYRTGQAIVVTSQTRWSLERQVRLGAGLLVILGIIASLTLNPRWVFLSAFVGFGLAFAGFTDFCPMGLLLGRMPWNRNSKLKAIRNSSSTSCVVKD